MGADFSGIGRLLANTARARMVDLLLDGRPATGGELARAAGTAPPPPASIWGSWSAADWSPQPRTVGTAATP